MSLISVLSSNLAAVGYDGGTLVIAFHGGRVYAYYGVPRSVYYDLMLAESHGRYFHENVKDCYPYERIA